MEDIIILLSVLSTGLTIGEFPFSEYPVLWLGKVNSPEGSR